MDARIAGDTVEYQIPGTGCGLVLWSNRVFRTKGVVMKMVNRSGERGVALETTLLVHGVPSGASQSLADELSRIVRDSGGDPAVVGVVNGVPTVGMTDDELRGMLLSDGVMKANAANLGVAVHTGVHAATTVSTTMELAAGAGVRVFATGGIGGVHVGYGERLDISSDLMALSRFPVAVVTSGVKSILDVESTREALETLGVLVIGYQTNSFPAFYLRESDAGVDVRVDTPEDLAGLVGSELSRVERGIVVANPIPAEDELDRSQWEGWLASARKGAERAGAHGRGMTPAVLGQLHELSGGATLTANLALVRSNARLAGQLAGGLAGGQ